MQTILVTGTGGFLGGRIMTNPPAGCRLIGLSRSQLDITDPAAVNAALRQYRPDAVVHCAAISDTGYAEAHPEESFAINVKGSVNLAAACLDTGAKLLYSSSDQVYSGCPLGEPLSEHTPLHPVNVYGRHKLMAEERISQILPSAVGLRLTWMYDWPVRGLRTHHNLPTNILRAAMEGTALRMPVAQQRGITWVMELVDRLTALLQLPGGVYNAGAAAGASSYDTALFFARELGAAHPEQLILPDHERFLPGGCSLAMDTAKIAAEGIVFPGTEEGFCRFLALHPMG